MTREDAIEELTNHLAHWERLLSEGICGDEGEKTVESLRMAIKALEQDPCEDAISRQAVKAQMIKYGFHAPDMTVTEFVDDLPSVTPKQKIGHWIIKDDKEQGYDIAGVKSWYIQIMCDKCGFIETAIEGHTGQYNYCPMCGADMRGDE